MMMMMTNRPPETRVTSGPLMRFGAHIKYVKDTDVEGEEEEEEQRKKRNDGQKG